MYIVCSITMQPRPNKESETCNFRLNDKSFPALVYAWFEVDYTYQYRSIHNVLIGQNAISQERNCNNPSLDVSWSFEIEASNFFSGIRSRM